MKICAKMDCGNYVFSHGYCKFHQYLRQDSAFFKAKERQQEKVAVKAKVDTIRGEHHVKNNPKYVKKHTGELALFQSIWATRKHESFLSGIPLGDFNVSLFAHILAKGQNKYPLFKLYEKNIALLTEYEHFLLDSGTMDSRAKYQKEMIESGYNCDWLRITDLADKLKEEYKNRHKEGDVCPHCKKGFLVLINGNYPYNVSHLQCIVCDSTYILE